MLENIVEAHFAEHVGDRYRLHLDDSRFVTLELIEVTSLASATARKTPGGARREPFSIVFRGSPEDCLQQSTYQLEHEQMGTLDLFLVPIGQDEQGYCYEAVFN
jgi:hypothetical protein